MLIENKSSIKQPLLKTSSPEPTNNESDPVNNDIVIRFKNAVFQHNDQSNFVLKCHDIDIFKGNITLITGPQSGGKSALLDAILDYLICIKGEKNTIKNITFYPSMQDPWLPLGEYPFCNCME